MAQNIVDISILSPLKFVKEGFTNEAKYNTKYFDDYIYQETIPDFYSQQNYWQVWQKNDNIPLQVVSNYAPHQLELYDCDDNLVPGAVFIMAYKPTSIEGTGQRVYEATIGLNGYDEGIYRFRMKSGGDPALETRVSEWFCLKQKHENSFLFEYWHDENDHEVVFETGIKFGFRIMGGFPVEQYKPGSNRTLFIDQPNNAVQLSGRSFSIWKLLLGDSFGLPQWVIERINQIFLCSNVLIDGKQFVANDGAEVEATTEEYYPLAGWALDVRPAQQQNKKRFLVEGNVDGALTVVTLLENKGFGTITGQASQNLIQTISTE